MKTTKPRLRHQPPAGRFGEAIFAVWRTKTTFIALLSLAAIGIYLILRFGVRAAPVVCQIPLWVALALGGIPLVYELLRKLLHGEFGSDLLAGISILTAVALGDYLVGSIIVLMLAGGEALENYAVQNASSVLRALANRMPATAHRKDNSTISEIALEDVQVGDVLVVYPHETCPVDGEVIEGSGVMNEAYLTGEPFEIGKVPGSSVISGAVNGQTALVITASQRAENSRYAKIMRVVRDSERQRPRLRRLGDRLGAIYTPLALAIALAAWAFSRNPIRFLAVLVIATPCPLLIAIPVAIIGSISLAARRSIIIRNPVVLEQITACRTAIFDKTGTLTYGEPRLVEQAVAPGFSAPEVLALAGSLELYSKHPLAKAVLHQAKTEGIRLWPASRVSEPPGQGLQGSISGHQVEITSRAKLADKGTSGLEHLPPAAGGLECVVALDNHFAAAYRFRDAPRAEGAPFIRHLGPRHGFNRVLLVSGDRESEVRYLADEVGIREVYAQQSPEDKLAIVRRETAAATTLYVGDGINDAPAMMSATVGMAVGQSSDVTAEAADVVAVESSLQKVDEFMHISRRMRAIALQSAIGGIILSLAGMLLAAAGLLSPIAGAVGQEIIDLLSVLNALRAAFPPKVISDIGM